jgi:hypothetical protein
MGQPELLVKLETGNKNCEWVYRFWANPGILRGGVLSPTPVLALGSALGWSPRVALSSTQVPRVYPRSGVGANPPSVDWVNGTETRDEVQERPILMPGTILGDPSQGSRTSPRWFL